MLLTGILVLSGCDAGPPSGQVIARVDGTDITRRELLGELEADGVSPDADLSAIQGPIVERLVNRTLLARAAEKALVDRTPAYQAAIYRYRQMMLAQTYTDRLMHDVPQPMATEVAAFIAANPQMFDQRRVLLLDRVTLAGGTPLPPPVMAATTMEAAIGTLKAAGVGFSRARVMEDTRMMDAARASTLSAAASASPVVRRAGGLVLMEAPVTSWPVPPVQEEFEAVARATLLARRQGVAADRLIATLRAGSDIRYQAGFEPSTRGTGVKAAP